MFHHKTLFLKFKRALINLTINLGKLDLNLRRTKYRSRFLFTFPHSAPNGISAWVHFPWAHEPHGEFCSQ
jgi:hypothetical protein